MDNKKIVLGVCGGIAAYKACDLTSRLKKMGANIDVIMTKSATKFVSPLTFQSLSWNKVITDMFEEPKYWEIEHISLAQKADLFVVAPATANVIAKLANGIADDMLTTTILATQAPVIIAPAMNVNMYNNPIVQKNLKQLKNMGYIIVDSEEGRMACGDVGKGKMAEPATIVHALQEIACKEQDLYQKTLIVTAGPTREAIDPVRYLTNYSSGKFGYAIAEKAVKRGAKVILISGPTNLEVPNGVELINIKSTMDMYEKLIEKIHSADVVIKCAAVADYTPIEYSEQKIKKTDDDLVIRLKRNPDIALEIGKIKGKRIIVGFAAETNDLVENAKKKLHKKNFDFIVANNIGDENVGFSSDNNKIYIVDKWDEVDDIPTMAKTKLADIILDKIVKCLEKNKLTSKTT